MNRLEPRKPSVVGNAEMTTGEMNAGSEHTQQSNMATTMDTRATQRTYNTVFVLA